MKKVIVLLVVVVVLGAAAWAYFALPKGKSNGEGPKAQTVRVERGQIRRVVSTTGHVKANLEVEIKCKASGEVIKLPFDISETVKKGDLLVQLDPVDEERSLKRAEVNLAISKAKLEQARLNLKVARKDLVTKRTCAEAALLSAEAQARDASAKFERLRQLATKNLASREEHETAETADIQAKANLANAKASVEELKTQEIAIETKVQDIKIAEAQVEADKISLSDASQRLAETRVVSPIEAVVASRDVQIGQIISSGISNVGGGTSVMTLADLSRIFILASVDESDIGQVKVGQPSLITADAFPNKRFRGQVVQVATKGVNASDVVTFEVKIEVAGHDRYLLKPEMTANIDIVIAQKDDVLLVPVQAVARRRRQRYVFVGKEDGSTVETNVTVGITDGESMEIQEGLREGQMVVLSAGGQESRWRSDRSEAAEKRRQERMRGRMMRGSRR